MIRAYEGEDVSFSGCARRGWWLWGWLFWRHWNRLRIRLDRWGPWHRLIHWLRWGSNRALRSMPIRYHLSRFLGVGFNGDCPHCGYEGFTDHDDLFECADSGTNQTPNGTDHWWRGMQTCARCGVANEYGDSSL